MIIIIIIIIIVITVVIVVGIVIVIIINIVITIDFFVNSIIIISPVLLPVEWLLQYVALFLFNVNSDLMETLPTNMKLCSLMTHFDIWSNVLSWDLFYWQHSDRGLCRISGRLVTAYVERCIIKHPIWRWNDLRFIS